MSNIELRKHQLRTHIHVLESRDLASGASGESDELFAARMELMRLDDAQGIRGPVDMVQAICDEMRWPKSTSIRICPDRTIAVELTDGARARLELMFRSVIFEQISAVLRKRQRRKTEAA